MGGAKQTGGSQARIRAAWTAGFLFLPSRDPPILQLIDAQAPPTWVVSHSSVPVSRIAAPRAGAKHCNLHYRIRRLHEYAMPMTDHIAPNRRLGGQL